MKISTFRISLSIAICAMLFVLHVGAQNPRAGGGGGRSSRSGAQSSNRTERDTANALPRGLKTWKIDPRFGTVTPTVPDTVSHLFHKSNFTEGDHGQYNMTGNLGSPRYPRIYTGQQDKMMDNQFIFGRPYDWILGSVNDFVYTNTKSPITNLSYLTEGNKINGDDHLRMLFATNINKNAGIGAKVDYLFGRGYFDHQQQSSLGAKLYGSYRGDVYSVHGAYILDRTKNAENGGLSDITYITHPEYYSTKYQPADMPVNLQKTYNRMKVNTFFLTHRYNLGYYRYLDKEGNVLHSTQGMKKAPKAKKTKAAAASKQPADSVAPLAAVALPTDSVAPLAAVTLPTDSVAPLAAAPQLPADSVALPTMVETPVKPEPEEPEPRFMVDSTMIRQFIPVAAFIHTAKVDHNNRRFIDNAGTSDFYLQNFLSNDSINDLTRYLSVQNTFAIEMTEGFKKWVKTGMRLFGKHEYTRFTLPDENLTLQSTSYNYFTVGGQLYREQGKLFHYNVLAETRTTGADWGEFNIEGFARFNIPVRKDTITIKAQGFIRNEEPSYYYRHFHGTAAWWDNDLSKVFRTRIEGILSWRKTALKVGIETIQNHTFFQEDKTYLNGDETANAFQYGVHVAQAGKNVQLLSATLDHSFKFGPLNWDIEGTYQKSSDTDVLPVPAFTGWTNLYFLFHVAKVLRTELGADMNYFTSYYAPAYSPIIGQYAMQDTTLRQKVGNYPWVNVYANFHLKSCRFFVMFSHVNCTSGNYFLVPNYPTNQRCFRVGISWNFFN